MGQDFLNRLLREQTVLTFSRLALLICSSFRPRGQMDRRYRFDDCDLTCSTPVDQYDISPEMSRLKRLAPLQAADATDSYLNGVLPSPSGVRRYPYALVLSARGGNYRRLNITCGLSHAHFATHLNRLLMDSNGNSSIHYSTPVDHQYLPVVMDPWRTRDATSALVSRPYGDFDEFALDPATTSFAALTSQPSLVKMETADQQLKSSNEDHSSDHLSSYAVCSSLLRSIERSSSVPCKSTDSTL